MSPFVLGVIESRLFQAVSMIDSSSAMAFPAICRPKLPSRFTMSIATGRRLGAPPASEVRQETREIIGHMVDMGFARPAMERIEMQGILVVGRGDEHGCHAERM